MLQITLPSMMRQRNKRKRPPEVGQPLQPPADSTTAASDALAGQHLPAEQADQQQRQEQQHPLPAGTDALAGPGPQMPAGTGALAGPAPQMPAGTDALAGPAPQMPVGTDALAGNAAGRIHPEGTGAAKAAGEVCRPASATAKTGGKAAAARASKPAPAAAAGSDLAGDFEAPPARPAKRRSSSSAATAAKGDQALLEGSEQLTWDSSCLAAGSSCILDASQPPAAAALAQALTQATGGCCLALLLRSHVGAHLQFATSCEPLSKAQAQLLRKAGRLLAQQQRKRASSAASASSLGGEGAPGAGEGQPAADSGVQSAACALAILPINASNQAWLSAAAAKPLHAAAAAAQQLSSTVYVLPFQTAGAAATATGAPGAMSQQAAELLPALLTGQLCSPCICAGERRRTLATACDLQCMLPGAQHTAGTHPCRRLACHPSPIPGGAAPPLHAGAKDVLCMLGRLGLRLPPAASLRLVDPCLLGWLLEPHLLGGHPHAAHCCCLSRGLTGLSSCLSS